MRKAPGPVRRASVLAGSRVLPKGCSIGRQRASGTSLSVPSWETIPLRTCGVIAAQAREASPSASDVKSQTLRDDDACKLTRRCPPQADRPAGYRWPASGGHSVDDRRRKEACSTGIIRPGQTEADECLPRRRRDEAYRADDECSRPDAFLPMRTPPGSTPSDGPRTRVRWQPTRPT